MSDTPMCHCNHRRANHSGFDLQPCMASGCECKAFSEAMTPTPKEDDLWGRETDLRIYLEGLLKKERELSPEPWTFEREQRFTDGMNLVDRKIKGTELYWTGGPGEPYTPEQMGYGGPNPDEQSAMSDADNQFVCDARGALFELARQMLLMMKRRAALEEVATGSKNLRFWEQNSGPRSRAMTIESRHLLDRFLSELDALTPTKEES